MLENGTQEDQAKFLEVADILGVGANEYDMLDTDLRISFSRKGDELLATISRYYDEDDPFILIKFRPNELLISSTEEPFFPNNTPPHVAVHVLQVLGLNRVLSMCPDQNSVYVNVEEGNGQDVTVALGLPASRWEIVSHHK